MNTKLILKKITLFFVPHRFKHFIVVSMKSEYSDFNNISFSQEGEDLILDRLFSGKSNGFYVDIGAHHPFKYSNTFKFYLKGWQGVNIDAMPESMVLFDKYRTRDINIEQAISDKQEKLTFHVFNDHALNTFDYTNAIKYENSEYFKIIGKKQLETKALGELLERYFPDGKSIDFMSIDVEGYDFQVLKSNNWVKFKPLFILIEILEIESLVDFNKNEIYIFLLSKNYFLHSKTVNTFIFKCHNF